jgi:hypothetical protein
MTIIQGPEWNFYSFASQNPANGEFYAPYSVLAVLCDGNAYEGEDNPLDGFRNELAEGFKVKEISVIRKGEPESDLKFDLEFDLDPERVYSDLLSESDIQYFQGYWTYMDEQARRLRERHREECNGKAMIRVLIYEPGTLSFDELGCPAESMTMY